MVKKPKVVTIDSRRIKISAKNSFVATGPALIQNLPIEIIQQILSLAIDSSHSPLSQQWDRLYQAVVCREWYKLRKERTKFVFISVRQMNRMIGMIESNEVDVEGVKEVVFDLSQDTAMGKMNGLGQIIESCRRIESLTIHLGYHVNYDRDRNISPSSPILRSMRRLNLRSLTISSGMARSELVPMLPLWRNLKSVDFSFLSSTTAPNVDVFRLNCSLQSIRIRSVESPAFISSLTSSSNLQLRYLHLDRLYGDREEWCTMLGRLLPNLESLHISHNLDSAVLSEAKKLKSLVVQRSENLLEQGFFESLSLLTSLTYLKLRYSTYEREGIDELLTKIEKVLPTLSNPLSLTLSFLTRHSRASGHPIFASALRKGITIKVDMQGA